MTATLEAPAGRIIGKPVDRIDGRAKVSGRAQYAADTPAEAPLHAVAVTSTIARGRIASIDAKEALAFPGVVAVMSHENAGRLENTGFDFEKGTIFVEPGLQPFQSDAVAYWGQYVAVVIADSFESARAAARLVHVRYDAQPASLVVTDDVRSQGAAPPSFFGNDLQYRRGDFEGAFATAATKVDAVYTTPTENHVPLEPSATVARWLDDGTLEVHDATQWVVGGGGTLAHFFAVDGAKVHVICPFVGGGFGSKGFQWPHVVTAALAARLTRRTVRFVVPREQTFATTGHRSETEQRIRLGADASGRLVAMGHDVQSVCSRVGDFDEPANVITPMLYACGNVATTHRTLQLDISTPTAMRAPGEAPGSFALESALDELAYALGIDPLEVRVRNHTDRDPSKDLPFTSKHLLECYERGASRFGWQRRSHEPGSMRDGREALGWGVATATYPALISNASARVVLHGDGRALVEVATHDLGTGAYTILAQVAAERLGIALERVEVHIGDSRLPPAPVAGGSQSTASVAPAVAEAADRVRRLRDERGGDGPFEARADLTPEDLDDRYSLHSFGAHFAEVRYDEAIARVRVTRVVSVMDVGRILNAKTARSQVLGGVVFGIGMALHEETVRDLRSGAIVTNNLADYHIPVNADVPEVEVEFVEEPDLIFNPLGVRGVGEIGITGVAAAIANAVYHASGVRVRDLPILPEKLLG